MTLFRKPVKGDLIRNKNTQAVFPINDAGSYDDPWFSACHKVYEFVTVTAIEPPPEPLKTVKYFNLYKNSEHGLTVNFGNKTRKEADDVAADTRVGCVRVEFVEGTFDD